MAALRKFEVRQADDFLGALVANASDGIVEAYVSDLADMAGLSRVQAQVGLRVLVESKRIVIERRGRRATPGRFRILTDAPVGWRAHTDGTESGRAVQANGMEALVAEDLLRQENAALGRENTALRDRIAVLEARLAYHAEASRGSKRAVG